VVVLEAGDQVTDGWLEALVGAVGADPEVALAGPLSNAAFLGLMAPDRFWFRFFRLLEGHDLGMRPYLWSVGLEAFSESPWTGIGVGRFPELARGLAPHSLLLACIAEGGLLHTAVLAALAVIMARTAYLDRSRLDRSRLDRSRLDRSRLDRSRLWAVAAFALSLAAPLDGRVLAIAVLAPLWMRPEGQAGPDPSR
jgi:O-antigen ligase